MKAWWHPMAYEVMIEPSMSACGDAIISGVSLQVPGSDSSALTTRYRGPPSGFGRKPHFIPHGNPAPPRPRRPESLTEDVFVPADVSAGVVGGRSALDCGWPASGTPPPVPGASSAGTSNSGALHPRSRARTVPRRVAG